jgi:hypothetical protein
MLFNFWFINKGRFVQKINIMKKLVQNVRNVQAVIDEQISKVNSFFFIWAPIHMNPVLGSMV